MDTEINQQPGSASGLHLSPGFPHSTEESTYHWSQQRCPSRDGCTEELQSCMKKPLYKCGPCSSTPTMTQKWGQTVSKVPWKLHSVDHTRHLLFLIFIWIVAFLSLLERHSLSLLCTHWPMCAFRHPPELEVTCKPLEEWLQLWLTTNSFQEL